MIRGRQPVITGGTEVAVITHSVKIVISGKWLHVYKVENVEVLLPCWSSNNAFCSPTCSAQRGASRILPTGTKIIIHLWNIPWIFLISFSVISWSTGQLNWPTALRLVTQCPYLSWNTLQSSCMSSPPTGWASRCLICVSIGEPLTPSGSASRARPSSSGATPCTW